MPVGWEWLVILAIALLLFGGTKLAGLGKAAGRSVREFTEETKGLRDKPATEPSNRVDDDGTNISSEKAEKENN